MNWTKNKPTVPGWYWYQWIGYPENPGVYHVVENETFRDGILWYGPITPPGLPKE
jgi:hypothetical protein